ncbi:MAG: hypothetical protein DRJ98_08845 [Thermoprotei archaeon]|nr:MAG: hypothetical protein DRJ98_08845 [Thermoprotei archaeon]
MGVEVLGYVVGETTVSRAVFVSKSTPRRGQYVELFYDGKNVLGMVQGLIHGSVSLTEDIHDASVVEKIKSLEKGADRYLKGVVTILGDVETLRVPDVPPPPGTEVYRARRSTLSKIFGEDLGRTGRGVRLGVLISDSSVPVYLDVNRMVSRHLAILAVTGAGKSNTVAVLAERIVGIGGCVVICDMHSEYADLSFSNGGKVHFLAPRMNPVNMSVAEMLRLLRIDRGAHKQERYFRKAWREALDAFRSSGSGELLELVRRNLERMLDEAPRGDRGSIQGVINKIEDFVDRYGDLIDYGLPDVVEQLRPRAANVLDLGSLDEEAADAVVSHYLRRILQARKDKARTGVGLDFPVFVFLEEAHILAPKDRQTLSKYWIGRIAREGRKFGVGMCLVSQRPKALDPDSLSQTNNKIILRLVEPSDLRYVQQASELLSEDLLQQLPSLNVGEAVVLGLMVKVPALVRIDGFAGHKGGGDPDIVSEWREGGVVEGGDEDLLEV